MKFHPNKCKVLPVSILREDCLPLPFCTFQYNLSGVSLDMANKHTDLGVIVASNLSWTHQADALYMKASSRLGLVKRGSHFEQNQNRKKGLYLSIIRSQFEHCSTTWY